MAILFQPATTRHLLLLLILLVLIVAGCTTASPFDDDVDDEGMYMGPQVPPTPHLPRTGLQDYYTSSSNRLARSQSGNGGEGSDKKWLGKDGGGYLNTYVDHFSSQTTDTSTFLHSHFHILSSSQNTSLSYTVTTSPSFSLLSYALSPSNSPHTTITSLDDGDGKVMLVSRVFIPSLKRRNGEGAVGVEFKFGGWEVVWRGVRMRVYVANWLENGWNLRSQSHIAITDLPDSLTPGLSPSFLSSIINTTTYTTSTSKDQDDDQPPQPLPLNGISAEQIADLFILEVSSFNSRLGNAVLVFDQGMWRSDTELWESIQKASWDDVVLEDKFKASLKHEYKSFFASEGVYKELGVPWKRGIIFLGPPGNGKTITLKATMKDAEVPILYVKSFRTFAGDEAGIRWIFTKARQQSPCLLIFEDLDSLITENNRSFFLNEVDGLEDNDGLLMIATTNHFDKLDPAISNRPSRFDRKYYFGNPTPSERRLYATYWQNKLKPQRTIEFPDAIAEKFVKRTDKFSYAYMKEAFISTLLLLAGDEDHKLEFGETLLIQVAELRKELDKEVRKIPVMAKDEGRFHHDNGRQSVFAMSELV